MTWDLKIWFKMAQQLSRDGEIIRQTMSGVKLTKTIHNKVAKFTSLVAVVKKMTSRATAYRGWTLETYFLFHPITSFKRQNHYLQPTWWLRSTRTPKRRKYALTCKNSETSVTCKSIEPSKTNKPSKTGESGENSERSDEVNLVKLMNILSEKCKKLPACLSRQCLADVCWHKIMWTTHEYS